MTDGPNPQLAPVFSSFGQLSQVLTKVAPASPIIVPWKEIPPSAQAGVFPSSSPSSVILPDHQPTQSENTLDIDLNLGLPLRSAPSTTHSSPSFHDRATKKTPHLATVNPAPSVEGSALLIPLHLSIGVFSMCRLRVVS